MKTEGILDAGGSSTVGGGVAPWATHGTLDSSTEGGGTAPWAARRRAEARLPGRLDGEWRGASLGGSTAGTGCWRAGTGPARRRATDARERQDGERRGVGKEAYRLSRDGEGESMLETNFYRYFSFFTSPW